MSPNLALFICVFFILWLFAKDIKLRPMTSLGLWVALFWIVTITRPISLWFDQPIKIEKIGDYLDGSPIDRMFYVLLIASGVMVLARRKFKWGKAIGSNRWLFAFFLYGAISIIWSCYPFVSFKRWIKDIGSVVMVFIILTESSPFKAIEAVLARLIYIVIPLSFLYIKYFPELGRTYNFGTWEVAYCGIATSKNGLGYLVLISGLFFIWDFIYMRSGRAIKTDKIDLLGRVVLGLIALRLLIMIDSSTSLLCLIIGTGVIISMNFNIVMRQVQFLGIYTLLLAFLFLLLYSMPEFFGMFTDILNRDITLTGRTDIWAELLKVPINPILGTGYSSFWLKFGADALWDRYIFKPIQAHNGYLEIYLQLGLIGMFLLMGTIIQTGIKLKKEILRGSKHGILLFSFFFIIIIYNMTEAVFNVLTPLWIIFLIAALKYPYSTGSKYKKRACNRNSNHQIDNQTAM